MLGLTEGRRGLVHYTLDATGATVSRMPQASGTGISSLHPLYPVLTPLPLSTLPLRPNLHLPSRPLPNSPTCQTLGFVAHSRIIAQGFTPPSLLHMTRPLSPKIHHCHSERKNSDWFVFVINPSRESHESWRGKMGGEQRGERGGGFRAVGPRRRGFITTPPLSEDDGALSEHVQMSTFVSTSLANH